MKEPMASSHDVADVQPPSREFMRTIWRYGDSWSRAFLVLFPTGYLLPLFPFVWLLANFPFEVAQGFALAYLSFLLYTVELVEPMFNVDVQREAVQRGWLRPDDAYHLEAIRYLEARGRHGRMPGAIGWGLAYWAIWYGTMGGGAFFGVAFYPTLGVWTPYVYLGVVNVPVIAGSWVAARARNGRMLLKAEKEGYRLIGLYPSATARSLLRRRK